jgi:hypothetical protein
MQAMPEQLAAGLAPGTLRTCTTVHRVGATSVHTDTGRIDAAAVVVATDPVTAHELLGGARPTINALTTYYHLVEHPIDDPTFLHVDAGRAGPVVNVACVSAAAPSYGRPGATLVASTVLGEHDASFEPTVRDHAAVILDVPSAGWEFVAVYAVPRALPLHVPGQPLRRSVTVGDGLFVAGDHRDTPSIQGALVSGRRAGEAVLLHLKG